MATTDTIRTRFPAVEGIRAGDEQRGEHTNRPTPINASWVLRIDLSRLSETPNAATAGRGDGSTGVLDLLEGDVANMERYGSIDWLADVAHGLLDPIRRRGRLWTPREGSKANWATTPLDPESWEEVQPGAPIESRIYEYHTTFPNPGFLITKMCHRSRQSKTSPGSVLSAATFREKIMERDQCCVVSGIYHDDDLDDCIASHLIPKRLGEVVRDIIQRYVDIPGLDFDGGIFDPCIGILLENTVHRKVDRFAMGFYHPQGNADSDYVIHLFNRDALGLPDLSRVDHGAKIKFPSSLPNGSPLSTQLARLKVADELRASARQAAHVAARGGTDNNDAGALNKPKEQNGASSPDALDSHMTDATQPDTKDITGSSLAFCQTHLAALESPTENLEPPEGVLLWHYIQGVTHRFATPQFKALQGALHTEKPGRYHGDSDDDSDYALDDLDYPTKWLDDAWAAAEEAKMAQARLALMFDHSKDY